MTKIKPYARTVAHFALFTSIALVSAQAAQATVTLSPGADVQKAVTAAPAGTAFVLKPGIYRMQSVQPKNNDTFSGSGTVVFDGAEVLSFTEGAGGSGVWVANAAPVAETRGVCDATHPLCMQDRDLFIDSVLQTPVASLANLTAGSYYFDTAAGKVYLPSDPSGSEVEMSKSTYAFFGQATGVKISHIIVEKYTTVGELGAVGGTGLGTNWFINYVESRWNHGTGVQLGSGSSIYNSFIHHNGDTGLKVGGIGAKVVANEISWNNYAGFSTIWEAGATKFWGTTNLLVQSNYVHDNTGKGLWTDTNNVGTVYTSNTVVNNTGVGIQHEVSYSAVIRNNIVKNNSSICADWLGNAQIRIMNSSNADVYGNTVEAIQGGNGIAVYNQSRGSGTLGPWVSINNNVHNNHITYNDPSLGMTGMQNDVVGLVLAGNKFDYNAYTSKGGGTYHWFWGEKRLSFKQLQALGQETHGTSN